VKHEATTRTLELTTELRALAQEIDARLLPHASAAAQAEWFALRSAWPDDGDVRRGARDISEVELGWVVGKVRRFRQILRGLAGERSEPARKPAGRSDDFVPARA
jgi:hypothetical protein